MVKWNFITNIARLLHFILKLRIDLLFSQSYMQFYLNIKYTFTYSLTCNYLQGIQYLLFFRYMLRNTGSKVKYVTVGRTTYCYAERGTSSDNHLTLVLVHGFAASKDMWVSIIKASLLLCACVQGCKHTF